MNATRGQSAISRCFKRSEVRSSTSMTLPLMNGQCDRRTSVREVKAGRAMNWLVVTCAWARRSTSNPPAQRPRQVAITLADTMMHASKSRWRRLVHDGSIDPRTFVPASDSRCRRDDTGLISRVTCESEHRDPEFRQRQWVRAKHNATQHQLHHVPDRSKAMSLGNFPSSSETIGANDCRIAATTGRMAHTTKGLTCGAKLTLLYRFSEKSLT